MRSLIISDIHANLAALDAVLRRDWDVDELWCLGDVVGYGAEPLECIESLMTCTLPFRSVAGNHDLAAVGELALARFIPEGQEAIGWTASRLAGPRRRWLKRSALLELPEYGATLVHASPIDPVWMYINSIEAAGAAFADLNTQIGLFGHTHTPIIYYVDGSGQPDIFRPCAGQRIDLDVLGKPLLLNPGSVGQPRDGDPRSSCAVLDLDAHWAEFHRFTYSVEHAQGMIRAAGLPESLAERLAFGV